MTKPTIIPNWKYQKPSKGGYRGLKKLLKYVSNRESPDHHPVEIDERWTDCGLGKGWRAVYENAGKLAGPYVLAHHLVIAPAPDLMELVPDELKHDLVREVTERTIEAWHEARGLNTPEFSHTSCTTEIRMTTTRCKMLHTHVFVAGTIENSLGERRVRAARRSPAGVCWIGLD
ncbi:MAG: hypothetical protein U0670_23425 [Anaerolineae bacterium]